MADFNQHIYEGKLQETFTAEDIGLEEQFRKLYDKNAPFSHASGSALIYGVFATSGINYEATLHKAGVGDHRLHAFDFSANSLLGIDTPAIYRPDGRKLRCSIERTRVNYCCILMQLISKH